MTRFAFFILLTVGLAHRLAAQDVNVTYDEWVRFPPIPRAAYLTGVLDQILSQGDETAIRWKACLARSKRTLAQIAEDLEVAVRKSPIAFDNVPDALRAYGSARCPDLFEVSATDPHITDRSRNSHQER
jgi:hypothetical protein